MIWVRKRKRKKLKLIQFNEKKVKSNNNASLEEAHKSFCENNNNKIVISIS